MNSRPGSGKPSRAPKQRMPTLGTSTQITPCAYENQALGLTVCLQFSRAGGAATGSGARPREGSEGCSGGDGLPRDLSLLSQK
jgi:hypothetical protein